MTTRALCAVLLALSALAYAPSTATASYPGERLANNPTLDALVELGLNDWRFRAPLAKPCAHPIVMLVDDLQDPDDTEPSNARAEWGGCRMWFATYLVQYVQAHPMDFWASITLGQVVTHELGHTAALWFPDNVPDPLHSANPRSIMYVGGDGTYQPRVRGLWAWAHARVDVARHVKIDRASKRAQNKVASEP